MYPDSDDIPMTVGEMKNLFYGMTKILFVDPDTTSYSLVSIALAGYDIEIIQAGCGLRAIQLFRENPFINGIITEIGVRGLDGFEILRAAREVNPLITVIAHTSYVYNEMKLRCNKAGFNEFIPKPIDL